MPLVSLNPFVGLLFVALEEETSDARILIPRIDTFPNAHPVAAAKPLRHAHIADARATRANFTSAMGLSRKLVIGTETSACDETVGFFA
jgi:hypothetical protein